MKNIVDEMVTNREERLMQRFLSLIDSRKDDDTTDSSRDECRSEYSDASRDSSDGYANVGFRVVRTDR